MPNKTLNELFLEELADMYSAENQIVEALPKLIKACSSPELKQALQDHLGQTEYQITRIEKIFSILGLQPQEENCEAMEGLLEEADEILNKISKSPVLDAAIICAAQKVEHYEMATYGTLRAFAKHLDMKSEVIDLLQDSLDEEGAIDKKLTKIAEGSMFTSGINEEALQAQSRGNSSKKGRR